MAVPLGFQSVHPSGENPFVTHSSFPDPITTATAMLGATTRLRAMTYVYIVTMRDPFTVAKQVGTVSILSGGRFALGVGAGWLLEEIALLGHDPRTRGSRMDEQLDIISGFLRDGEVEHHGRHYDFGPTAMHPVPPVAPPILVGGKSERALARAARFDGWLGMNYPVDEMWVLLDRLVEQRRRRNEEVGPSPSPPVTVVIPNAEPTPDLYARMADRGVTATLGMPWYPGDPAYASLDDKRKALAGWAERFGLG